MSDEKRERSVMANATEAAVRLSGHMTQGCH